MKYTIIKNKPRGFRATGIVLKDDKILLMKQVYRGEEFYNLPGGAVENGEKIEDACIREIKEESNIDVAAGRLIYVLDSPNRLNFVFSCDFLSGELKLGGPEKERMSNDDQYEISWVDIETIENINLTPRETKDGLLKYLKNKEQPVFLLNTYTTINKNILIIAPDLYEVPPVGYGGIERVATMAYLNYVSNGYTVDIISKKGSKFHDFSIEEINKIDFKKYHFVLCYRHEEPLIRFLDRIDPQVYLILENNFSPKFMYLSTLKNITSYVLSEDQQKEYEKATKIKLDIIHNGIDMGFFVDKKEPRSGDILYIGGLGRHKSPLSCLEYAIKYDLAIDFYGPILFRENENNYKNLFLKKVDEYKKARIMGEIENDDDKVNILNKYKYFIFLPGIDDNAWVEPWGLAPLEAMACGCTIITQLRSGGHLTFCNLNNVIQYTEKPKQLDPDGVIESIKKFDFLRVFKIYYPK